MRLRDEMRTWVAFILVLLFGCGGESTAGQECVVRSPVVKSRWDPASLGAVARWGADPRYVTLSGSTVSVWRNYIDGRSGVLVEAGAPDWETAWGPACRPAVRFVRANLDRLDELSSGQPDGSRAAVIDAVAGLNAPFSVLMTAQPTSTSTQIFLSWYSLISANPRIVLEQTSGSLLKITRRDGSGTFAELTGDIQLGTSLRRIGATFDGTSLVLYVDAQLDNSTSAAGGQDALVLGKFRVGDDDGGGTGADMHLFDLTIIPRAIGFNEWLRYYEWSVKQYGQIQAPAFFGAGTGVHGIGAGTITPSYPASLPAGALLALNVTQYAEIAAPTVPLGWFLSDEIVDGNIKLYTYFRDLRASAGESGTIDVGVNSTSSATRMYAFTGVMNAISAFEGYVDEFPTAEGGGTSCPGPSINPYGYGRLGVAFYAGLGTNVGVNSGSVGGTWVEAAEYNAANNLFLQVQTVRIQSPPTPVTGGTTTWTTAGGAESLCQGYVFIGE